MKQVRQLVHTQIYKQLRSPQFVPRWVLDAPRLKTRSSSNFEPFIPTMNVFITSNDFVIVEDQMQLIEDKNLNTDRTTQYCFKGVSGIMNLMLMRYEVPKGRQICEGIYLSKNSPLEYKFYDLSENWGWDRNLPSYYFEETSVKFHFSPIMDDHTSHHDHTTSRL